MIECRDYAFDTPQFFINDLIDLVLKDEWPFLAKKIAKSIFSHENRVAGIFLLAEILNTNTGRHLVDQINLPLVPWVVSSFVKKYSASSANAHVKLERTAYLLLAIMGSKKLNLAVWRVGESIGKLILKARNVDKTPIVDSFSRVLDNDEWLVNEIIIRTPHARKGRASHLAMLSYSFKCLAQDERMASRYLEQSIIKMKNELAWYEIKTLMCWLEKESMENLLTTNSLWDVAWVEFQTGDFHKACNLYQQLFRIHCQKGEYQDGQEAFRKMIRSMERLGGENLDRAIKLAEEALAGNEFAIGMNLDQESLSKLKRTLGWCYVIKGDYEKAINVSQEAEIFFSRKINNKISKQKRREYLYNLARTYNNLGAAYELMSTGECERKGLPDQKVLKKAKKYHQKCLKIMKSLHSLKWVSGSLLNLSIIHRKRGRLNRAIQYARSSETIKRNSLDFDELPVVLFNKSIAFIRKGIKKGLSSNEMDELCQDLFESRDIRRQQDSKKQVMAILALAAMANHFLKLKDHRIEVLTIEFKTFAKELLHKCKESDKLPLIHKALVILRVPEGDRTVAIKETELPSLEEFHV